MTDTSNLSIGEAAKYLGVSRDTLRRWEKRGKIKTFRSPTNRRYYTKELLDDALHPPVSTAVPEANTPAPIETSSPTPPSVPETESSSSNNTTLPVTHQPLIPRWLLLMLVGAITFFVTVLIIVTLR